MTIVDDVVKKPYSDDVYDQFTIDELKKCTCDPLYFAENYVNIQHPTRGCIKFEPYEYQKRILDGFASHDSVILMTGRQMGKALSLDTPMLTTNGWTTMGRLKVGDSIYSTFGKPTKITFATDIMYNRTCYNVEFDNGEIITADAEHLWEITINDNANPITKVLTTQQLYDFGGNFAISLAEPIVFSEKNISENLFHLGLNIGNLNELPEYCTRLSIEQKIELISGIMQSSEYSNGVLYHHSIPVISAVQEILSLLQIWSRIDTPAGALYSITFTFPTMPNNQSIVSEIKIISITLTESVPVRCIQVDSPNHLFLCGRSLIPTHNTTCSAAYLLWRVMFTPDFCILVAANKFVQAKEIMDRIRYAYENLPNWLRAGVVEYNKSSMKFDNGSSIVSRATSPDSGRGLSISLLYLDEFAFVRPSIAAEFWTAMQPTLSNGGACIITSTPNSDDDQFANIWFGAMDLYDENGMERPNGVGKNGFKAIMAKWDEHPDRNADWEKKFRASLGDQRFEREFACIRGDTIVELEINGTIHKVAIADANKLIGYGAINCGEIGSGSHQ